MSSPDDPFAELADIFMTTTTESERVSEETVAAGSGLVSGPDVGPGAGPDAGPNEEGPDSERDSDLMTPAGTRGEIDLLSAPPATVELLVIGHLPVRAALWLTPYADAVARDCGAAALLRLDGDETMVQVLGGPADALPPDACRTLPETINRLRRSIGHWIIRPSARTPMRDLLASGAARLTILGSADQVAVLNTWQLVKEVVETARRAGLPLPELGIAVIGSDSAGARRVADRINHTSRDQLGIEIPLVRTLRRMDATIRASGLRSFPGQARPELEQVMEWIGTGEDDRCSAVGMVGVEAADWVEAVEVADAAEPTENWPAEKAAARADLRERTEGDGFRSDPAVSPDLGNSLTSPAPHAFTASAGSVGLTPDQAEKTQKIPPTSGQESGHPRLVPGAPPTPRVAPPTPRVAPPTPRVAPPSSVSSAPPDAPPDAPPGSVRSSAAPTSEPSSVLCPDEPTTRTARASVTERDDPPVVETFGASIPDATAGLTPRRVIALNTRVPCEVEAKDPVRATEPDADGGPVALAANIAGLRAIRPRCPGHERVELALDDTGRLHLLVREESVREVAIVEAWARSHHELLVMACSDAYFAPGGRAQIHLFTDTPRNVADLHGSDYQLHLLTQVEVNGQVGWFSTEL